MDMLPNFPGRLRNTQLPITHGLLPLFEAVVNSIHGIDEAKLTSTFGHINIDVIRKPQGQLALGIDKPQNSASVYEDIEGFKVTDNGIGFNDVNFKSFKTLDSEHKLEKGCHGIGRLLWLKAFHSVNIGSIYYDATNALRQRQFVFDLQHCIGQPVENIAPKGSERKTTVHLDGFKAEYRKSSRKTAESIANSLFEHCLWYFIRDGGAPEITLCDGDRLIELIHVYDHHMITSAMPERIDIFNKPFHLTHVKLRANSQRQHSIAFCAGNRLVHEETLKGKIPGLYGRISDSNGEYIYTCYIHSPFLDEKVYSDRTGFNIPESPSPLFEKTEITMQQIRETIIEHVKKQLSDHLTINMQQGKDRVDRFVSSKAPKYRPILDRIPQDDLCVDPNISDKELDIVLHKHLSQVEEKLLSDGHDLMIPVENELPKDYEDRLGAYLKEAEDIKKSDLANYVAHRRVIIDILAQAIRRNPDGKYSRENVIHKLIMPMQKTSNEIMADGCNLWLIDERLAFHDYLASDKPLQSMPITGNTETKEPDIVVLKILDNPILVSETERLPLASIVVIEIKRPMRDDAQEGEEKNPIEQAMGYVDRIRNGSVKTAAGRPVPASNTIPGFCYILCDITRSIKQRCKILDLKPTSDGDGYFGYNSTLNVYIEVISFDRMVNGAKERNKAFFDKLGLPSM